MIHAAILGFGVVGSGTAEMLTQNRALIREKTGEDVCVKYIVDIREFPESPFRDRIVRDFALVEQDPEVDIVIETIGGAKVAYDFTKRALLAGKSVVTSNKELVADHGVELLQIAKEKGVFYLFEAAVGGGIPALKPLVTELSHNQIREVSGILNGTTNFILTRMYRGGLDFAAALKEAQENGYAEADPTADIEGHDACRKIAILAALAYGKMIPTEQIHTEGITGIRGADVQTAMRSGASIKLLGRAIRHKSGGLYLLVAPFLIGNDQPFSHIDDVYNGVVATGDFVGEVMFYGRGAGSYPTASAVVSDVCALLRKNAPRFDFAEADEDALISFETFASGRYLAVSDVDKSAIKVVFGDVRFLTGEEGEIAFLTDTMTEKEMNDKVRRLSACGAKVLSTLRVY